MRTETNKWPLLKDEDGGGSGGGYYRTGPKSLKGLEKWWKEASKSTKKYPVYALFLATDSDESVRAYIEYLREECSLLSGEECCFVYFRKQELALNSIPWTFSEHSEAAVSLARLLGIRTPSLLFFENFETGKHVTFSMQDMSKKDISNLIKEIFANYYANPKGQSLSALESSTRKVKVQKFTQKLKEVSSKAGETLLKTVVKKVSGGIFS